MKIHYLFVLAFFCSTTLLAAIEPIEGEIIYKDRVEKVRLEIPVLFMNKGLVNFIALQKKVKYYDEQQKKQVLRPKDKPIGYRFQFQDEAIEMRTVYRLSSKTFSFLRLSKDGNIQLFKEYHQPTGSYGAAPGQPNFTYFGDIQFREYMQRKGGQLVRTDAAFFRKTMKGYFKDCPALVEKIEQKIYTKKNVPSMIQFFYRNCPNNWQ